MPDPDAVDQYISEVAVKELQQAQAEIERYSQAPAALPVKGVAGQLEEIGEGIQMAPCGHDMPGAGANFCPECGSSLAGVAPPVGSGFAVEAGARVQPGRPKPEGLLTPEERAERARLHTAAVKLGSYDPGVQFEPAPENAETFLIHFVEDGFTAFGVVWYRGQELEVAVGSPRWEEGWNQGTQWLRWQDAEQYRHCQKIYFRRGPWPGERSYAKALGGFAPLKAIGSDKTVTGPSVEELLSADRKESARRRGVPGVRV